MPSWELFCQNSKGQFVCNGAQNELSMLEFIHAIVEILDKHFAHICELDIMYNLETVSINWSAHKLLCAFTWVEACCSFCSLTNQKWCIAGTLYPWWNADEWLCCGYQSTECPAAYQANWKAFEGLIVQEFGWHYDSMAVWPWTKNGMNPLIQIHVCPCSHWPEGLWILDLSQLLFIGSIVIPWQLWQL